MGIFSAPDFAEMRRRRDFARLCYWAQHKKDLAASRGAVAELRKDPAGTVEYLYETAVWAQSHAVGRRKMLPSRGIALLNEATRALVKVGPRAIAPLAAAVRVYDEYGNEDERVKLLFLTLAFDVFGRIGRPAAGVLQDLARHRDKEIRRQARAALDDLNARGLLAPPEDEAGEGDDTLDSTDVPPAGPA